MSEEACTHHPYRPITGSVHCLRCGVHLPEAPIDPAKCCECGTCDCMVSP
jgi:hypothetical protein